MLLMMSCDAYNWPPHENHFRTIFLESKSVLLKIESEMIADGLDVIGPPGRRRRAGQAELTDDQKTKYADLFARMPYHWHLQRNINNDATWIELYAPPILGSRKTFMYSYTHRDTPANERSCEVTKRSQRCGDCYVPLGDQWFIEYSWWPEDIGPEWDGSVGEGKPTPEEIHELHMKALKDCFDAGLKENGFVPNDR